MLEIFRIPLLQDNYSYLINDLDSSKTACIDPGMAEPNLLELEKKTSCNGVLPIIDFKASF